MPRISEGSLGRPEMALDQADQAPMFELNHILWKSVRGPGSAMPTPFHRFWFDAQIQEHLVQVKD